jgi:hypothetical protein
LAASNPACQNLTGNSALEYQSRFGEFTAFTSVEPITAPCDELDLTGIDWV